MTRLSSDQRGLTTPGSLTPRELVAFLRHVATLRACDWHHFGEAVGALPRGKAKIGNTHSPTPPV